MKKLVFAILLLFISHTCAYADVTVFGNNDKFGLRNSDGEIIVEAKYKKLVRLGTKAWIMQDGTKFGILHESGRILVEPKYTKAERVLGKFVKFHRNEKFGIFDEMGFEILPVEYSSIDLLYGGMFVTCKNYKYGISDFNGQIVLDNIFDDIYMPNVNELILVYGKQTYKIERRQGEKLEIPYDMQMIQENYDNIKITEITSNPLASTGYYGVTVTDYVLKTISSISPAYEQTIDELMFSKGADSVSVLKKFSWLPLFPFVYVKKYFNNLVTPNNGPLNSMKSNLKHKIKE